MTDIQYLAKLITQLADSPIDSPCDVYEEIIKIGGHWYTIGRPEGKHYIDALNLDNNGYLLKKSIKAYIAQRQNYLKNTKEKLLNLDYKFYLDDRYSFFDDDEGYDWTVRESALKALMNYADFAAKYKTSLVPILKSLRKRIKDEQENGWIATIQDINTILNMLKKL
jgi:hypothetical protein